jgi:hypothetical protein
MRKSIVALAVALIAAGNRGATAEASPLPPTSYPAGATEYEILFVTSGTISPTSGSPSTYNTFVTSQANEAGSILPSGLTWNAVVSTQLILQTGILRKITNYNASALAPSSAGIPVYNTAGQLITNLGLYSAGQLSALPEYNQYGNLEQTAVATGSNASGTGSDPLGSTGSWNIGQSNMGNSSNTAAQWISSDAESGLNDAFAIYGLSTPIQIRPSVTPEPTTLTLLGTGLVAFCGYRRLKRGRKPKHSGDETDPVG